MHQFRTEVVGLNSARHRMLLMPLMGGTSTTSEVAYVALQERCFLQAASSPPTI